MLPEEPKTILIAGGTGMVGSRLAELLHTRRYRVTILTRGDSDPSKGHYHWDPSRNIISKEAIETADAIVNLSGAGLADQRWTPWRRRTLVNSRVFPARVLAETLSHTKHHVKVVVNASAVGYYGNTHEQIIHEDYPPDKGFLAKMCVRWEDSADQFKSAGLRTVILRFANVLSMTGGYLPELLKPMRFGIAPVFGNGTQYVSWIHIDDLCRLVLRCVNNEKINGTYNAAAPGYISNRNFIKLLQQIRGGRYITIPLPPFLLFFVLGGLARALLDGCRASPSKIQEAGFEFRYPEADDALKELLEK